MNKYTSLNTNRIIYQRKTKAVGMLFRNLSVDKALTEGLTINEKQYVISPQYKLILEMHRHAPHLKVKIHDCHKYTIAELYELDPNILHDLLVQNGGSLYLAKVLIGYETLYNQENELLCQENQML